LARFDETHLRRHGAIGPDLKNKTVVVRGLTDTRVLDGVANAVHRAEDRVDRDRADLLIVLHVFLGGDVPTALANLHLTEEANVFGQRADLEFGVGDLDVVVAFNLLGEHFPLLVDVKAQRRRSIGVQLDAQLLDVQNDLGDVFQHTLDRGKLVDHAINAHPRDRRAFQRRQQNATKAIANRRAKTLLEGLDNEAAVLRRSAFALQPDLRRQLEVTPTNTHIDSSW